LRLSLYICWFIFLLSHAAGAQDLPFRKTDKGPYGTYVLYDQLPALIPDASITISHNSPSTKLKYNYLQGSGYIVVAAFIKYSKEDIAALETYLQRGNVLVLSAYFLDDEIEKWLNIKLNTTMPSPGYDSIQIFDSERAGYLKFHSGRFFQSYISRYDSSATDLQVWGKYSDGTANFISFKKSNGYVVVQTQPLMFSNYHLIRKRTKGYTEIFFSSLPGPMSSVIWDEYSKASSAYQDFSALGFIMRQPPLRNAFWWALAGLLLVVFFSFKRRQRVIPVLSPLTNNSLDMVRTVSDMYFFSHRNEVMAKKKIAHWLEFLRVKYNIFTTQSPDAFWQTIKMRSNMSEEKMNALRIMVETFRSGDERITDGELIHLNHLIDNFYTS
jgi:hypothetical protein